MKIKILVFIFLLVTFISELAGAQSFRWGVEAGVNSSNLVGKYVINLTPQTSDIGLAGGFFFQVNLNDSFSIQPEILYSQKGDRQGPYGINENYFEVPVLFKFNFGSPVLRPNFFLGAAAGLNVSTQFTYAGGSFPLTGYNSFDCGVIAGLGVDINKFSFSGRYELGLTDDAPNSELQNSVFSLLLGYYLN